MLDLLQALHVVDAGNLADSIDNSLQVFEVGNLENNVYVGLAVFGAG